MKLISWRRLPLFARLAAVVAVGLILLFAGFAFLGIHALDASTNRILDERLVLTEMAASQIEAAVQRAFNELLKATTFATFDPASTDLVQEYHVLAHSYGRIGTLTLGVFFLDPQGTVVMAEPPEAALVQEALVPIRSSFSQPGGRMVSHPFMEPRTGRPAVAMTVAVKGRDGEVVAYLSGLIDLSSSAVAEPLERALKLGNTGHAELVTAEGFVIASSYPGTFLHPGEHQGFYRRVLADGTGTAVATVPYEAGGVPTEAMHIMAVVPLSVHGWGLALGGDKAETLAPVTSLRWNLALYSLAMLAFTLAISLWVARQLVHPVLALTRRAEAMAGGDLTTPIRIDEGGEIGVLGEALNETRQRLLEARDKLTEWNLELEERVRRRSQEVAELQAQVELERLRGQLISQVSHEFRTPIGLIKGYATTLLRPDVSPDRQTWQEFLTIIREEAEKLEALVEEALDTARLKAGTFPIHKEEVALESLVQRAVDRARARAERHAIARDGAAPLPRAWVDSRRLEQVFDNLLDNALRYSPGGRVTVGAQVEDSEVHFTVADEGVGIPAGELEKVFDVFYRGSSPTTGLVKGSGLGLAICRGIVEAHGGHIWAESSPGKGSRFHFTVPLGNERATKPGSDS